MSRLKGYNADRDGSAFVKLSNVKMPSYDYCASLCQAKPDCASFTFNEKDQICEGWEKDGYLQFEDEGMFKVVGIPCKDAIEFEGTVITL